MYDTSNRPLIERGIKEEINIEPEKNSYNTQSIVANFENNAKEVRDDFQYVEAHIYHVTIINFKYSKYTVPVTFEFTPDKGSIQVNMFDKHR